MNDHQVFQTSFLLWHAAGRSVATKYIEWLSLGAIALRVPGKLMWDANRRRFSNNEEANRLLKPFLRQGWELKA